MGCGTSGMPREVEEGAYGPYKDADDSDIQDFENLEKADNLDTFDFDDDSEGGAPPAQIAGPTDEEEGKGWMAVKPFIGALVAPTDAPKNDGSKPAEGLEVEWVYGYRGHDSRDNLVFDEKDRAVYPIASFVIAYDHKTHTQKVFQGHNDDIVCLCQHPTDKNIIATGQVATISRTGRSKKPYICVTDVKSGEIIKLPATHKRAVRCVAFSSDGTYLASVGADNNNTLVIWDWKAKAKVAEAKGDTNKIHCIEWSDTVPKQLSTVGVKHAFFWDWSGPSLKRSRGLRGKVGIQSYFCHKYNQSGMVVCGGQKGSLVMFDPKSREPKVVKKDLHKGAIFALCCLEDGGYVTGGKDGYVRVLSSSFQEKYSFKIPGRVRSIFHSKSGQNLVVGTSRGEIFIVPLSEGAEVPEPIVSGHFEGELWGLNVPGNSDFLTAGEDNVVHRWDMDAHKATASGEVSNKKPPKRRRKYGVSTTSRMHPSVCARAVAQKPDGSQIAIGRNDGKVAILDGKTLEISKIVNLNKYSKRRVRKQIGNWIEAMSYSPCGTMLAVGTHGITVNIIDATDYKVKHTFKSHNSVITHLDWSADSKHLRSTDKGYELLFFDVDAKDSSKNKHNPYPKALKDIEWATNTCILTWGTQNVWDSDMDGSDVNACDVLLKGGKALVATGDDHGNVNLFRYPVLDVTNQMKCFPGHSAHVTCVRFTPDGKHLISAGGGDKCVVQWKVVG